MILKSFIIESEIIMNKRIGNINVVVTGYTSLISNEFNELIRHCIFIEDTNTFNNKIKYPVCQINIDTDKSKATLYCSGAHVGVFGLHKMWEYRGCSY